MRTTRSTVPLLALALAAALGGCHAGADSARAGAPEARGAASGSADAAAPSASPTRPCATADLVVAPAQHQEKQGLEIERFTLSTTAKTGCTLTGAPNLVPKGPLSAQMTNATVDLAVSQQPVPDDVALKAGDGGKVPLLPGKTASFYLAWYAQSSVVCVQSNGFGFNAPGESAYRDLRSVSYRIGPLCDGVFYVSSIF